MSRTIKIIAALLALVALAAASSCRMTTLTGLDTLPSRAGGQPSPETQPAFTTTLPYADLTTTWPQVTTTTPVAESTTAQSAAASASVQEVLDLYANAINLTRGYQGTVNVHHVESFSGNIVEAQPLGALTTTLGNTLVGMIADPTDSNLVFTGGVGVNEDGETVPLLLPKRGAFSLPAEGVRNAFMDTANGMRHVVITLLPESVDYGGIPYYNAGAIGYLDTSALDFKIITVNYCTITYTGSVIDAYIRDDGYISSVQYTINLSVTGGVTGLGITGSGTMEGVEYETWELQW